MSAWANMGYAIINVARGVPQIDDEGALRNVLIALLHWCDEQGYSLYDAIPEAQRTFSDNCLQWLADDGKIILGEDGRYRTPANHRRAHLRVVQTDGGKD